MVKSRKKSCICECGKIVRLDRSIDKLESGDCNLCIRAAIRPIARTDKYRHIYTICNDCGKEYRFRKWIVGHKCRLGKSSN